VIIIDENAVLDQRQLLQKWRIAFRHIGHGLGQQGMQDEQIIPLLHTLRHSTFFTRDLGFCSRRLCHSRYCLVCMAIEKHELAYYVRRLLKHPQFDTDAKRMGTVIRLSPTLITVWRLHVDKETVFTWV
jgi:hypothetical protein